MHSYKVKFTVAADKDLLDIFDYIYTELDSPESAKKITDMLFQKCRNLAVFPKQGPVRGIFDEERIRTIHYGKYAIIYYVDDISREVHIRAIKYARIDFEGLLGDIF